MKYLTIAGCIATSFTITSASAFAVVRYPAPPVVYPLAPPRYALNTLYFSGDIGTGTLATPDKDLPETAGVTSTTHSNMSLSGGGSMGFRHAVNPLLSFGLEAGYDYNGQAEYAQNYSAWYTLYSLDKVTYKVISEDFHVLATSMIKFPGGFNFFVKGGGARVNQKLRIVNEFPTDNVPIFLTETSTYGYKPMAAAGIGYQIGIIGFYAQYSRIFATNAENFSDLLNEDGTFSNIVSVDSFKLGASVNLSV